MKKIKGFDGIRGFSILFVILTHLNAYKHISDYSPILENITNLFSGSTGVRIFFSLSGFLITYLLLKERHQTGSINILYFFARRFLRLLPVLIIFYSLIAILTITRLIYTPIEAFAFSILYLYNFVPNKFYTGELGHTWSLAVEEQYYFTWPFVVKRINKNYLIYLIAGVIILLCALAYIFYPTMSELRNYKAGRWFIPAIAPIIQGSIFAYFIFKNPTNENYFKNKNSKTALLIGLAFFTFSLYAPDNSIQRLSPIFQGFGISIFISWVFVNQNATTTKFLEFYPISYIGKISYGIYVYQGLFLRTGPSGKLLIQSFPINIILTMAVAILSYEFIEKPILKYKSRFSS